MSAPKPSPANAAAGTTPQGPLQGIRVVDVSTILAGPMACQILGDFGADVIKIEHPIRGDGLRGHGPAKDGVPLWWKEVGRNKRTIGLDIRNPQGAEIFQRLVAAADVLVENFRPGTLERWGHSPDVLQAINPGLVMARISGFGQVGPYATRAGFGTLAEAMSGFAALTGFPETPPTLPAFGLADSICAIATSSAVSMALFHRDARGGGGQVIDLSILEPIMAAVGPAPTFYDQLGIVAQRTGNRSSHNAPRNTYLTADEKWVAISTSADTIAERVLHLVGHPEVLDEPWFATGRQRAEHAELLDAYVGGWIRERSREEVLDAFAEVGAAIAPVYGPDEILDDPQVVAAEMIPAVDDPELGPVRMHNVMWRMSATPGAIRFTGRPPGQDTDTILVDELGMSAERVAALRAEGVVA
jgi:crotonobetainyl-CoA:carnitine CoA-transferase CaiB-like acyl-CoA transferase